jgi:hypothetical protein
LRCRQHNGGVAGERNQGASARRLQSLVEPPSVMSDAVLEYR